MADFSPALSLREGGLRAARQPALALVPSPPPPCSRSGLKSEEVELSLSLARTKTLSYCSTARVRMPLAAVIWACTGNTLQCIALKYGVTMEQIKRANKLFTNDCIFMKKILNIPITSEKPLFNGLNSLESPENETVVSSHLSQEEEIVEAQEEDFSPVPQDSDIQSIQSEEVSAKDFLQRLDLQIKLSTQAGRKLKDSRDDDNPYATSLYQLNN